VRISFGRFTLNFITRRASGNHEQYNTNYNNIIYYYNIFRIITMTGRRRAVITVYYRGDSQLNFYTTSAAAVVVYRRLENLLYSDCPFQIEKRISRYIVAVL